MKDKFAMKIDVDIELYGKYAMFLDSLITISERTKFTAPQIIEFVLKNGLAYLQGVFTGMSISSGNFYIPTKDFEQMVEFVLKEPIPKKEEGTNNGSVNSRFS